MNSVSSSVARALRPSPRLLLSAVLMAAPALAAADSLPFTSADFVPDGWGIPLLVGSLVLLVIGLALKAKQVRTRRAVPPAQDKGLNEGIGRYRLQLGRGAGD